MLAVAEVDSENGMPWAAAALATDVAAAPAEAHRARGRDGDREPGGFPQNGGFGTDRGNADQDLARQADFPESLAIASQRALILRAAVDEVEHGARQSPPRRETQFLDVEGFHAVRATRFASTPICSFITSTRSPDCSAGTVAPSQPNQITSPGCKVRYRDIVAM